MTGADVTADASSATSMRDLMRDYRRPRVEDLLALEQDVARQLREPGTEHLKLLGYGEFTIAVAYPGDAPRWACKRLPPSEKGVAERFKDHIARYVAMLEALKVKVVPTDLYLVPAATGGYAVYLSQPILPSDSLVPNVLRRRAPSDTDEVLVTVLETIRDATTPQCSLDGHLANWAWLDGEPWYLDISTPFNQTPDDRPELDVNVLIQPYPAFFRPFLRWWVAPPLLRRYYDLRPSLLELAGALNKEGLKHWIPATVAISNRFLEKPVTVEEVEKFYADDIAMWDFIYRMKITERRLKSLFGQTYQFLISPPLDRYGKQFEKTE